MFHTHSLLSFPALMQWVLVKNTETLENCGVLYIRTMVTSVYNGQCILELHGRALIKYPIGL